MKFTVSELKKRAYLMEEGADVEELGETAYEEPEVIPLIPRFLEESEELTGASRGTAYHRVMELLDLSETYTEEEVREAIRDFREEGRISEEMGGLHPGKRYPESPGELSGTAIKSGGPERADLERAALCPGDP